MIVWYSLIYGTFLCLNQYNEKTWIQKMTFPLRRFDESIPRQCNSK